MLGNKTWDQWIAQYSVSHQNPVNRLCHTIGIPLIALSLPLAVLALFVEGFWPIPLTLFVVGWVFQFIGHAVEGKPPEFFHDWRFLLVGLRWWMAKVIVPRTQRGTKHTKEYDPK
ncbi:MAG TPA: DUF962 domain-containing protein [Vicinamibacterales bacterium]